MVTYSIIKYLFITSLLLTLFVFNDHLDLKGWFVGKMVLATNSELEDLPIHVAAVVCQDDTRVDETLINFKSILLHSDAFIMFHVFTEDDFAEKFIKGFDYLQESSIKKFKHKIYPIQYPENSYAAKWKKLFKPCASQRLFIPYILKEVDSILYVDTDVVFMSPVENLWSKLENFNSTQVAAMVSEHEQTNSAWYPRFSRHPYYGLTGLNSGVMLMNMTRIRSSTFKNDVSTESLHWDEMMLPLLKKYHLNITWGDQDLLNVIFHYNPDMLMELSCIWNYRPDHCMYIPLCDEAKYEGVQVLHGCRRAFHNSKWPIFRAVYQSIESCDLNDSLSTILQGIERRFNEEPPHTPCATSAQTIIKSLRNDQHNEL